MDDDVTIIALLKSDPHLGYSKMLNKYRGLVGAIVWRILPALQEDSEECVADTFIQIWKGAVNEQINASHLKGLLICTARNMVINRYRKLKKIPTIPFSDEIDYFAPGDTLNELICKEDASSISALINELNEPNREILTRRYFLFESVKEISQIMKLTEKQIEN